MRPGSFTHCEAEEEEWSPPPPADGDQVPKYWPWSPSWPNYVNPTRYREQVYHPGGSGHSHAPGSLHLFSSGRRPSCTSGSAPIGVWLPFLFAALEGVHQWLVVGSWLCPVLSRTVWSKAMAPNPDGGRQPAPHKAALAETSS